MPSDKKRINLTIPDDVYERLQTYKAKNGILSDAAACYQLVILQLKAQENGAAVMELIQSMNMEQLLELSKDGFDTIKRAKKK